MTSTIAALRPKKEPKPHQVATVHFYLANKRCYNLSACGSGKTLPSVLSIRLLYEHQAEERILVVAPLSVTRATWLEHLEELAPDVPVLMLDSTGNRKTWAQKKLPGFKGVVVINPDGVKGIYHELVNWKPGLVIIDELAGYYRNCRTTRWKTMSTLLALTRANCWGFTGTPMTNGITDTYAQILLVNHHKMPRNRDGRWITWIQYRDMLCTQPYPGVWVPKPNALQRVADIMQPAIRFTREQVMKDIKEPIRLRKHIQLTPEQKQLMDEMIRAGKAQYGGQVITAKETQALVIKLTQIVTGSIYTADRSVVQIPYGPRLDALLDLREEVEQTPIIVAAPFIHTINRLEDDLVSKGFKVAVIIGDTAPTVRSSIIKGFQAGEYDFLICHPKTLSHGVTLTASHTVCWFAPLYDLELYAQLCDRIFRYGQEGQPLIVEFYATEAEARVYTSLRNKERLAGKFLDLFGD